jgi:hypothetical protein
MQTQMIVCLGLAVCAAMAVEKVGPIDRHLW